MELMLYTVFVKSMEAIMENLLTTEFQNRVAKEFGTRLKFLRHNKDMSMDELCLAIGTTKASLSRYENGKVEPTLDTARNIANYFMVTLDWLSGIGSLEDASASIPQVYIEIIRLAIEKKISPEKLKKAIELISD